MSSPVRRLCHPEPERPTSGNLATRWAYLLMSWSCAGGMCGGDGERTTPPVTA